MNIAKLSRKTLETNASFVFGLMILTNFLRFFLDGLVCDEVFDIRKVGQIGR